MNKQRMSQPCDEKLVIENTTGRPSLLGGYLLFKIDNQEVHIASVPSPNVYADRYQDSVVDNHDDFFDAYGNQYNVDIYSSNMGVDWSIKVIPVSQKMSSQTTATQKSRSLQTTDVQTVLQNSMPQKLTSQIEGESADFEVSIASIQARLQVEYLENEY